VAESGFQDMIIIPALQAQTQGAGPLHGCCRGRGGGGWQAGDPVRSRDVHLAGATGPTPSTPPLARTTSRRNRRRASRFVLAEFTEENYQVVWWIMASSALSLRFSLHLSRASGYSDAFSDVAPNPNLTRRPPDHEVARTAVGQGKCSLSVDMLSQCAYSYGVKIIKLAWVGTRTENFEPTVDFFRDVLGLRSELDLPGFRVLKLPDGSKVEVFGPDSDINRHFTTGPVAGFLVDDVRAAASELRSNRIEILLTEQDESGNAWVHFRAPDGNIYEFTQDPGVSRPH
jgi:catechol 2,3-dioxygenase-like lactoylglutathione lyase family enzyme